MNAKESVKLKYPDAYCSGSAMDMFVVYSAIFGYVGRWCNTEHEAWQSAYNNLTQHP